MVELYEMDRTFFETMTQGAFIRLADGSLVDVNPAALSLFGLSREEFFGRTSEAPEWRVIQEDGTPLAPEQHPSMVALRTGEAVSDFVAGVYLGSEVDGRIKDGRVEVQFLSSYFAANMFCHRQGWLFFKRWGTARRTFFRLPKAPLRVALSRRWGFEAVFPLLLLEGRSSTHQYSVKLHTAFLCIEHWLLAPAQAG